MSTLETETAEILERVKRGTRSFERGAAAAIERGHYRMIPNRTNEHPYLLRVWLSPMVLMDDGRPESGSSILLHHIIRADDDGALHDHPWDFTTTILSGGYREKLPLFWGHKNGEGDGPEQFSRADWWIDANLSRGAQCLHMIERVQPDTWTLVMTGPRIREWGFHPAGQPWQSWREYLGAKQS
ncbi:MAG: hypothetical protein E6Q97_29530 [Desulfurellales bacterium]|nr:MAG: hypothetical protein E6Q97_29530 [Desulfurellales bacterium]